MIRFLGIKSNTEEFDLKLQFEQAQAEIRQTKEKQFITECH